MILGSISLLGTEQRNCCLFTKMGKEKGLSANPVAAHAKAQKKREIAKSKAVNAASRNEKLARRNPERLQRQADNLVAQREAQGGTLKPRDAQTLERLEKGVAAITKARNRTGYVHEQKQGQPRENKDRTSGDYDGQRKRRRLSRSSSSEPIEDAVKSIPMPEDTPPPIPAPKYAKVDHRNARNVKEGRSDKAGGIHKSTDSSSQPVSKAVYESAPQMRDFTKEAVKFIPSSLNQRPRDDQDSHKERLLEPEEMDDLEKRAKRDAVNAAAEMEKEQIHLQMMQQSDKDINDRRRAYQVEIEDVEDEEA